MDSERKILKIKLLNIVKENNSNFTLESTYDALADFIIEDRRRICEPLVKCNKYCADYHPKLKKSINEVLKLAGVPNGEK